LAVSLAGCGGGEEAKPAAPASPPKPVEPKLKGPGKLKLPNLISNHMVLQAGKPVKIWGRDAAGQRVTVEINGKIAEATAGEDGRWLATLPTLETGGPHLLSISGSGRIVVQDVLVGEVWLASGQSNMQWPLEKTQDALQDIPKANHPGIRFFLVERSLSEHPADDLQGQWVLCTPESAAGFSAVAYYFGLELQRELKTPVGLIGSYWGGTPIQAWSPEAALKKTKPGQAAVEKKAQWWPEEAREDGYAKIKEWARQHTPPEPPNEREAAGWASPQFNAGDWKSMEMARPWEWNGIKANGVAWLRREFNVPPAWANRELVLDLGTYGDTLTAYWNGTKLEQASFEDKGIRNYRYTFTVPADQVGEGAALIAVRVFDGLFEGGLHNPIGIRPADEKVAVNLAGPWQYKMAKTLPPLSREVRNTKPYVPPKQGLASALYNAMIDPAAPYTLQGVIWYQGEANSRQGEAYARMFPAMIAGWRERWGQGDFPFLYVQLANFQLRQELPEESHWAELREAQRETLATAPNTGMAVAIDIGDASDIHPRNKKEGGRRLSLLARNKAYGEAGVKDSGPMVTAVKPGPEGKVVVAFDHALGLKTTDGNPPVGFALAGEDGVFQWAEAEIDGGTVVLSHPKIPAPRKVRYAWANNPAVNLVNQAGLPAVPFQMQLPVDKPAPAK